MLERQTIVDLIEVRRDDSLGVRLSLLIVEGDKELARAYHRISVEPGQDVSALMADINGCLTTAGEAPVSERDIERIVRHATAAG